MQFSHFDWLSRYGIWAIIITLSSIVAHFSGQNGEFGGLKCILARWNKPMKSENQTVVRFKQPIKIEKP